MEIFCNLIFHLVSFCECRYCWRKYHNDDASGHDLTSDKSTDPLAEKHVASTDDVSSLSFHFLDDSTTLREFFAK